MYVRTRCLNCPFLVDSDKASASTSAFFSCCLLLPAVNQILAHPQRLRNIGRGLAGGYHFKYLSLEISIVFATPQLLVFPFHGLTKLSR